MNSPIKTNQLVYSLQHELIDKHYDFSLCRQWANTSSPVHISLMHRS